MKSLKVVMASLLLTVGVVVLSSFAAKSFDSTAFARICYSYSGPTNPPSSSDLLDVTHWAPTTTIVDGTNGELACPLSEKLCVICFDDAQFTGTAPQKLSQALAIVNTFGFANLTFDPQTIVANGKSVTVYQKQ